MFERGKFGFDVRSLPMRGKRHPNGYVERRGKAGQLERSIHERAKDFPHYATEFGHLEADTVQGKKHQGGGNDPDRTPIEGRNCTQCARKDG